MHACQLNIQLLFQPFSWPDNLSFWQCVGLQLSEISIISLTIICLCTTFKPVKINPNAVIDVWSVASLKTLCSFYQNYTCHFLSDDMPLTMAVVLFPQVWFVSSVISIWLSSSPLSFNYITFKDMHYILRKKFLLENIYKLSVIWFMATNPS